MKKIFTLMAIFATSLAVVCCNNNNEDDPYGDDPDENEYVAPIKVDGDFSDWAKLDASKVAVAKLPAEGAAKEALKLVKVYADEMYVYIYFEWNTELIEYVPDVEHVPFHIYINSDGDETTGGYADQWTDANFNFLAEGFLTDGTNIVSYEATCCQWTGEVHGAGWGWTIIDASADLFAGAGIPGKYEMSMARELFPIGKLADNFTIGFDIQQDWNSVGILPIGSESSAASLPVTTVK